MLFGCFLFTVISILLTFALMMFLSSSLGGEPTWVFPFWLTEMMISFYWFGLLYWFLKLRLNQEERAKGYQRLLVKLTGALFRAHIIEAWLLSLVILPMFCDMPIRLLIAYPGTAVITVLIPLALTPMTYNRWAKKQASERIRPTKIRSLALRNQEAQRFIELFPECKTYIYDHKVENQVAVCLFLHRQYRPEREGLLEDITLHVPIDMKTKLPIDNRTSIMHYIFTMDDQSSSIMHLDYDDPIAAHKDQITLNEQLLDKFDMQMDRFPSLQDAPFQLVIRKTTFEII